METVSSKASRQGWTQLIQKVSYVGPYGVPKMRPRNASNCNNHWTAWCTKNTWMPETEQCPTLWQGSHKSLLILISLHIDGGINTRGGICPSIFSEIPWKLHIFLYSWQNVLLGSMSMRGRTFFVSKNIRKYFMVKWRGFNSKFCVYQRISNYKSSHQFKSK